MKLLKRTDNLSKEEISIEARENGLLLLVDKSPDWTSFDVCNKVRWLTKIKKVGHSGTLDPAATGLLVLGIGRGTKKLHDLTGLDKVYTGIIKLGATTKTDDGEAEEEDIKETEYITHEMILDKLAELTGPIKQKPPRFSAKKIKGKKMYQLAAKGIEFEVKEYDVEVYKFEIHEIAMPFLTFEIHCSKGTYIRSLARDLGEKLGCGAYLHSLRREVVGEFNVSDAYQIVEFEEMIRNHEIESI